MLKAFITILSDSKNSCFKTAIALGDIKCNGTFRSKKELVSRLKAIFSFRFSFCFKISIFEAFLSLSFLVCNSQNCRVFRNRCNLRSTVRNCFFVIRISFFSLLFFRRVLFYFSKFIT